jgi:hypothetical protein
VNEYGYPIRGILEQFKTGLLDLDTAEDVIKIYIKAASEKAYNNGVVDELRSRSERPEGCRKGELTPSGISVRAELMQSL